MTAVHLAGGDEGLDRSSGERFQVGLRAVAGVGGDFSWMATQILVHQVDHGNQLRRIRRHVVEVGSDDDLVLGIDRRLGVVAPE